MTSMICGRMTASIAAFIALLFFHGSTLTAALIHDYQLNGSLEDALGGPSLVELGGVLGPDRYSFSGNQGLRLDGAFTDPGGYTIEMVFQLNTESGNGWTKLIDFKNLSDNGLYWTSALAGASENGVGFYPIAYSPEPVFTLNQDFLLVISRDSTTNEVNVYIDGNLAFSFLDASAAAIFSLNVANFFVDDNGEFSDGSVDYIRIYDNSAHEADFDTDGDVDGDDFLAWQGGFGTTTGAMKSDGDYDNDEDVDGDDFLGWQSEFGSGAASNAAVPEPSTFALLIVSWFGASIFVGRKLSSD